MNAVQLSFARRKRKRGPQPQENQSVTTTTRVTGPYDQAFQQHLVDHHIYPNRYMYPDGHVLPRPTNFNEITEYLSRRRQSLSSSQFSDEKFERFQLADEHATKEAQLLSEVIPLIGGNIEDRKCVSGNISFTNLEHSTDGTLVPGKPDRYYGARPEQLDRIIHQDLDGYIIPSTQRDLLIAPNFFLEVKGPVRNGSVAARQATYVGALGARGIQNLQLCKDPMRE